MLDIKQLRKLVIGPALRGIALWSKAAEDLIIGTGLVESRYEFLSQWPTGPAIGYWQMEKSTHNWIWGEYLTRTDKWDLAVRVLPFVSSTRPIPDELRLAFSHGWMPDPNMMAQNVAYAAIMCRIKYWTIREALPLEGDEVFMSRYWKKYYNTSAGAGDPKDFIDLYRKHGG